MSSTHGTRPLKWVKSSYSGGEGGNCIEWAAEHAAATGELLVRDSKDPRGPMLTFGTAAWSSFVTAVRRDEFGA